MMEYLLDDIIDQLLIRQTLSPSTRIKVKRDQCAILIKRNDFLYMLLIFTTEVTPHIDRDTSRRNPAPNLS